MSDQSGAGAGSGDGQNQQRPSDFLPVEDATEALRLMQEGCKTLASAMMWTKNQEHVINTHLSHYSDTDKSFDAWIPKDVDPRKFMDDLARIGSADCFFSVSLLRANIFFRARFMGIDSSGLQFKLPEKIFKVQRRKDMRLPIPDGYVLRCEFVDPLFPDQTLTKKCIDISAGGIAFIVSPDEEAVFQNGLVLKNVTLNVKGRKIVVDAEVRHTRPLSDPRNPGVKVGVLFRSIKAGDAQHIASYVFEESRKYYSKFI